jgi:hypothetical protein
MAATATTNEVGVCVRLCVSGSITVSSCRGREYQRMPFTTSTSFPALPPFGKREIRGKAWWRRSASTSTYYYLLPLTLLLRYLL